MVTGSGISAGKQDKEGLGWRDGVWFVTTSPDGRSFNIPKTVPFRDVVRFPSVCDWAVGLGERGEVTCGGEQPSVAATTILPRRMLKWEDSAFLTK